MEIEKFLPNIVKNPLFGNFQIEFVEIDRYVPVEEIESFLSSKQYQFVHPYCLALYYKLFPELFKGKSVVTYWKEKGYHCYMNCREDGLMIGRNDLGFCKIHLLACFKL